MVAAITLSDHRGVLVVVWLCQCIFHGDEPLIDLINSVGESYKGPGTGPLPESGSSIILFITKGRGLTYGTRYLPPCDKTQSTVIQTTGIFQLLEVSQTHQSVVSLPWVMA